MPCARNIDVNKNIVYVSRRLAQSRIYIDHTRGSKPGTSGAGKFFTGFPRHNFAKKKSMGPKNGLERRAWEFYTICDKIQDLKVKIDEGIDPGRPAAADRSGSAHKFVWGCMGDFQKISCNFYTPPHPMH
jgi:hypothetical protein